MKFYVCSHNGWNPYSEEIKRIPIIYWLIEFHTINVERAKTWENLLKPTAELIGQITNPQVFKVYYENIKREERKKKAKRHEKDDIGFYEDKHKDLNSEVIYSEAETNYHYDPDIGVIDNKGNLVVSKEQYERILGLDGIAVSF
ncbi:MAG TPA: hypothetical protein P5136_02315 [Methanofastidiosum sp.]|nr:hypothetical protein [Methanofastidiosum sp.]